MLAARGLLSFGLVMFTSALVGVWLAAESRAQSLDNTSALVGAWTLNRDLTDKPDVREPGDARGERRGRGDGFGRRGGMRGGFGTGGRGGDARGGVDRDAVTRVRDAMRDIMNPPDHLTIVDAGSMVVLTGPDGRTTRLAPDGRKIRDENTGIERKTRWENGKLVSEISGAVPGKMIETFEVNPERHQLTITLQMDGGGSGEPRHITHVYDADPR